MDSNNADMGGMVIRIVGMYNGKSKSEPTVSGVVAYGKSGYEFFLGTVPISSKGQLYIQILDQAGLRLSDNIYIGTYNDCSKNLVLVSSQKEPVIFWEHFHDAKYKRPTKNISCLVCGFHSYCFGAGFKVE